MRLGQVERAGDSRRIAPRFIVRLTVIAGTTFAVSRLGPPPESRPPLLRHPVVPGRSAELSVDSKIPVEPVDLPMTLLVDRHVHGERRRGGEPA